MAIDLNAEMVAARAELSRFGSLSPRVVVDGPSGLRPILFQALPDTNSARRAMMLVIGFEVTVMFEERPTGVAFIAEAWSAAPREGESAVSIRPSTDPNRREVIVAAMRDDSGAERFMIQAFHRERRRVVFDELMDSADEPDSSYGENLLDAFWNGVALAAQPDSESVQMIVALARFASGGDIRVVEMGDFGLN